MKDLTPAADGLRRRMEATETLTGAGIEDLDRNGPVGRRVRALAGGRPLSAVLDVRTRRRLYALVVHDEPIGEVALDDTVIILTDDPQRLRLQRVEVEVQASWVDALQPLVEQLRRECGLQPATLSKFEAGLLAAGVALPGRLGAGSAPVGPDTTLGELAFTVIGNDIASMLSHEPRHAPRRGSGGGASDARGDPTSSCCRRPVRARAAGQGPAAPRRTGLAG